MLIKKGKQWQLADMDDSPPAIITLHGRQGASQAQGVAVVIDVLRAFSTACYVMAAGAGTLIAVAEAEAAQGLKRRYPDAILMGERAGLRLPGFDMGNSPSQVTGLDWRGRNVILTTSNGTLGLCAARKADQVLTGAFVNAEAIVRHIRNQAPARVSLVCMGSEDRPAMEDTLCAQYLRDRLRGRKPRFGPLRDQIRQSPEAAKFLDGSGPDLPPADLDRCLDLDRFDFVLRAVPDTVDGFVRLHRL
jgi:2-phosphosulfolactate phosphatase